MSLLFFAGALVPPLVVGVTQTDLLPRKKIAGDLPSSLLTDGLVAGADV